MSALARGTGIIGLAGLSGALLALSLPPFDHGWLAWFAPAPLLVAACGRRWLEAVGLGLIAGVVSGSVYFGSPRAMMGSSYANLPFFCLSLMLALIAVAAAGFRRRHEGLRWAVLTACAAIVVEWLTTFSPLPLNIALSQYRTPAVIQVAALGGIWAVSFLVWFVNAALAGAALSRAPLAAPRDFSGPSAPSSGRPLPLAPLSTAAVLVGAALLYSQVTLKRIDSASRRTVRVAAVQDHTAEETAHLLPVSLEAEVGDREELTRRAAAMGARLIVWSELCLGSGFTPDQRDDPTARLARELGVHLVAGFSEPGDPRRYNCAAIIDPAGKTRGIHRKNYPFLGERRYTRPGREAEAFRTELGRVGIQICFDNCYSELTRRMTRNGAQLIAMPNHDPPVAGGVLHYLHGTILPFRAVENRVPFVRSDSNGLSQIVDRTGRSAGQCSLWRPDVLVRDVELGTGRGTLYSRLGDWMVYLCMATGLCGIVWRPRRPAEVPE